MVLGKDQQVDGPLGGRQQGSCQLELWLVTCLQPKLVRDLQGAEHSRRKGLVESVLGTGWTQTPFLAMSLISMATLVHLSSSNVKSRAVDLLIRQQTELSFCHLSLSNSHLVSKSLCHTDCMVASCLRKEGKRAVTAGQGRRGEEPGTHMPWFPLLCGGSFM